jgi:hypothetical protein
VTLKLPVNLAKLVAQQFGKIMIPVTLEQRAVSSTVTHNAPTRVLAVPPTVFAGKGFVEDFRAGQLDGEVVRVGDRRIMILAQTMAAATPKPSDRVTIEGRTYIVQSVSRDPADATWSLHCRGV